MADITTIIWIIFVGFVLSYFVIAVFSQSKWYCPHCLQQNSNKVEVCTACGVGEKNESDMVMQIHRGWNYRYFFATYFHRVGKNDMEELSQSSSDEEIRQAVRQHLQNLPEETKEKDNRLIKGFTAYVEKSSYTYLRSYFRETGK